MNPELLQEHRSVPMGGPADLPVVLRLDTVKRSATEVIRYAGLQTDSFSSSRFLAAINRLQKMKFSHDQASPHRILVNFCDQSDRDLETLRFIVIPYKLASAWAYRPAEREVMSKKISDAQAMIAATDTEIFAGLNSLIGTYLLGRAESAVEGGSVSRVIGAIWIGLEPDRPVEDFAELIVHEYVHNALFVDDMVNALFLGGEGLLGKKENCVISAIRQIPRGYDKGFHSAYVAAVLARFFLRRGNAAKARSFIEPTLRTVSELTRKPHLLYPMGRERLTDLVNFSNDIAALAAVARQ